MAMARGKCTNAVTVAFMIISCTLPRILATSHVVGESKGWGFSINYVDWANGKSFAAGDTLVFNYQSGQHNVVPVNAADYRSCKATGGELRNVESTGDDKVTLKKGANYFICSIAGHCSAGMKLEVNAE